MFGWQIKYNKIDAIVILDCLDAIPHLKPGKIDEGSFASYLQDIRMWKAFRLNYERSETKKEKIELIERWKKYIQLRNDEDFVSHGKSKNDYSIYF